MSRGDVCLVDDSLINYCSDIVYNTAPKTYVYLRTNEEKVSKDVCCFYDCHPICGEPIGLPKKLNKNGSFKVWGYFCSFECARSFVMENNTSCNQEKELSLLSLMGIKTHGINFRLNRAPDKFLLKMFGGPFEIEEWRKENLSSRLWVIKIPDTERTCLAYECYLNVQSSKTITKTKEKESKVNNNNFELAKRKTPAHFTKKSLLSFVQKN